MKLIYQQMLAFFAVIITVIVVLGFSFIRTTRTMLYQTLGSNYSNTPRVLKKKQFGIIRRLIKSWGLTNNF